MAVVLGRLLKAVEGPSLICEHLLLLGPLRLFYEPGCEGKAVLPLYIDSWKCFCSPVLCVVRIYVLSSAPQKSCFCVFLCKFSPEIIIDQNSLSSLFSKGLIIHLRISNSGKNGGGDEP